MTAPPDLTFVVSTIGRPQGLRRLLESIGACEWADRLEVVVVDQSADQSCREVVGSGDWPFRTAVTTSSPGVSTGRNAGLRLATGAVVAFPNDLSEMPPGTPRLVIDQFDAHPDLTGWCGRLVTPSGEDSMLRFAREATPVTASNFMRTSISPTIFLRREAVQAHNGFDEQIGAGATGWYGAGEESDLLLRLLRAGARIRYDPALVVVQTDPRDTIDRTFVAKMLRYGCGEGHVWHKHQLPIHHLAYLCARKVAAAVVHLAAGKTLLARADLAWVRGCVAGLRDVPPRSLRPRPS
jgi:glycosyltransferase involved in cell wall biosynthesis